MLNAAAGTSRPVTQEIEYITKQLGDSRAGRIVLDTGCGTGERAIALARAGFDVVAFDSPPCTADDRRVRWVAADPLLVDTWPRVHASAVVCSAWWTASRHPQRMLRRLRECLDDSALLVVIVPVDRRGEQDAIAAIVRRAGFAIQRCDLDFGTRASNGGPGAAQIVARAVTMPTLLAVHAWGSEPTAPVTLDLRYEPDEAGFLDPHPADIWCEVCATPGDHLASHYAVDDPYGAERAAPVVARFFDCDLAPAQITCAAGVTSLLQDLCGLADGGTVASDRLVHGDLEAWAMAHGLATHVTSTGDAADAIERAIVEIRPGLLHLDRPGFTGGVLDLDAVAHVARTAARHDTVVLIDESALPYLGPAASSATLVNRVPNLVVLRGFTKAYSWGGIRVGFAVASPEIARHVRELVVPMQVAETSLAAATRMLARGDVFGRCRKRVRLVKPPAVAALRDSGFAPIDSHPDLPWIAMPDHGHEASRRLLDLGIRPLEPSRQPLVDGPDLVRITVPLADARHRELLARLATAPGGSHD